jgi:hypothetical protein
MAQHVEREKRALDRKIRRRASMKLTWPTANVRPPFPRSEGEKAAAINKAQGEAQALPPWPKQPRAPYAKWAIASKRRASKPPILKSLKKNT